MWFLLKKFILMRDAPRGLKISAIITFLGITLSVAVLVISVSVATGFETEYKRSILDFNAHMVLLNEGGELKNYQKLEEDILKFDHVVGVNPFIYRESMIAGDGIVKGVVIKGVDLQKLSGVSRMLVKKFTPVPPLENKGIHKLYLGASLAAKMNITEPRQINLMMRDGSFKKILVIGTFETGLYDYDAQFALMAKDDLQNLFNVGDSVTGLEIKLDDPDLAGQVTEKFRSKFEFPYQVMNWMELNKPIFQAVKLEKIMFAIIVGLLVLIGIFNITGTLILRMIYKIKDISTLSAIGMRLFFIRGLFTFHGTVLGFGGTFLGLILGVAGALIISQYKLVSIEPEIYFLARLPVKVDLLSLWIIAGAGFLVSLLVSFVSSMRISSVGIVDGLHGR
jgi:lipoprotein-releasing system permease protein